MKVELLSAQAETWDDAGMSGYAAAIFGRGRGREVGAGAFLGIPLNNGNTKATYTPPASGSSKTPYYVAGGVAVVALVGGLIWWKAA